MDGGKRTWEVTKVTCSKPHEGQSAANMTPSPTPTALQNV